jgi:hypothetical protein
MHVVDAIYCRAQNENMARKSSAHSHVRRRGLLGCKLTFIPEKENAVALDNSNVIQLPREIRAIQLQS